MRCLSCDHPAHMHYDPEGCRYTVTTGAPGANLVCPCTVTDSGVRFYSGPKTFFHGGVAGLRIGSWIVPSWETGATGHHTEFPYGPHHIYDVTSVYMVTELEAAKVFAAMCAPVLGRGGDVYRVEPLVHVSLDLECGREHLSWLAPRARIAGIAATGVRRKPYATRIATIAAARRGDYQWTL